MKYFILSDLHGSLFYLKAALKIYQKNDFDGIILLGDLLYHGPRNPLTKDYNPALVAELLNDYQKNIKAAIRGNCDSEVDQMVINFPIMSDYQVLKLNNRNLFISHGHIYHQDNLPPAISSEDLFLSGHTHLPLAEKKNGIYFGNPGSISLAKESMPSSYGVLDSKGFRVFDLSQKLIKEILFD
ncbi:MAG: phosphodiesterase [Erysipelotrichaceae bacterium]